MISNTDFVLHSIKYDLRKISFNLTSTTYTVWMFSTIVDKFED